MSDALPAVDWPQQEPYKTLIAAAETLEARGYTVTQLIEAMLVVGTAMEANLHGPRAVAIRLYAVADRYAQETARAAN